MAIGRGFPVSLPSYPASALWSNYRAALDSPYSVSEKLRRDSLLTPSVSQVYLAHLQGNLGEQSIPPVSLLGSSYPAFPAYQQLAAAHRLANIQRSLIAETGEKSTVTSPQVWQSSGNYI